MKKILCVILSLVLLFTLGSCAKKPQDKQTKKADQKKTVQGNSKAEPAKNADITAPETNKDSNTNKDTNKEPENVTPVKESKAFKSFLNIASGDTYLFTLKFGETDKAVTFTSARKGDKYYDVSIADNAISTIIKKDSKKYQLFDDQKTYSVTPLKDGETDGAGMGAVFDTDLYNNLNFTVGKTEVDGKSYDTEEFFNQGNTLKYCFNNDQLKYILLIANNQESKIEVVKVSSIVPDSLFDIPADYKEAVSN